MVIHNQEDQEAIEATFFEAFSKRKEISFVTVSDDGKISGIHQGNQILGIDLEDKTFKTDTGDGWTEFDCVRCLVFGRDERVMQAAEANGPRAGSWNLTLAEAEAAVV
jgi:hypothetical protein